MKSLDVLAGSGVIPDVLFWATLHCIERFPAVPRAYPIRRVLLHDNINDIRQWLKLSACQPVRVVSVEGGIPENSTKLPLHKLAQTASHVVVVYKSQTTKRGCRWRTW